MEFIGRLHPLVVHLPIGILLLAFLFEVLSRFHGYKKLKLAADVSLVLGTVSAMLASVSGWLLSNEAGYEEHLLTQHKISGLVTTALALILAALFVGIRSFKKDVRKKIRLFAFFPLMIALFTTGHFGGSITHGEDFLFSTSSGQNEEATERKMVSSNPSPTIIYADLIKPLLESKCYGCHSSKKQKGKLRLDGEEWILKGGKNGAIIRNGAPSESELFKRIALPIEDKAHMPPREKTQLTSGEIDLVSQWISDGASFTMPIAQSKSAAFFKKHIAVSSLPQSQNLWPDEPVGEPDEEAIKLLRQEGVVVGSLAEGNNYLTASFLTYDTFPLKSWPHLVKLSDQIISVRIGRVYLTKTDWSNLAQLKNLRMLYADNTNVTDTDVDAIISLDKLNYLNLAGTKITNAGLSKLAKLKSMQQLFLFGTLCTSEGIDQLQKQLPNCVVDIGGYKLPILPTDTLIYRPKPLK
jgi:uncharacterized membrane protein